MKKSLWKEILTDISVEDLLLLLDLAYEKK